MQKLRQTFILLFVLAFVALGIPIASAQDSPGSGLSISPTVSEFTIKQGESSHATISIKNITTGPITAEATINDFEADNTTGSPKIIPDTTTTSPTSIRPFVQGLDDVSLDVGEQKKVVLGLEISQDTPPGAYYGVVRYRAVPVGNNAPAPGEVALSASVGTIILITVPGNLNEQVKLSSINVFRDTKEGSIFFQPANKVGIEITNLGNAFTKPFGAVEVRNIRGKVVYSYQLNSTNPKANVLPGSSRVFVDELKNVSTPGRYTITANISYGNGGQILVMSKSFWYVPLWLLAVILAILIALGLLVYRTFRRYKRDERRSYRRKR